MKNEENEKEKETVVSVRSVVVSVGSVATAVESVVVVECTVVAGKYRRLDKLVAH